MQVISALSALGVTILLALCRPRLGTVVIGPAFAAIAGVSFMTLAGHISLADLGLASRVLWKPMVAIASIMVIAAAADRLGVISRLAETVIRAGSGSVKTLFLLVFCLSAFTAAILNNDSAILVLTPAVIAMIRGFYPQEPGLLAPFAFAVFMAAGVAPLVTSNPINLIVSDVAKLDFNSYAVKMLPVSLASAVASFLTLRWVFSAELGAARPSRLAEAAAGPGRRPEKWSRAEKHGMILTLAILGAYPVVEYFDGTVWIVALSGAIAACALCVHHEATTPRFLIINGVAWQVLIFLFGVYLIALGLRSAGVVEWLVAVYTPPGIAVIGTVSAAGSALINNHSMALINIVAIEELPGEKHTVEFLAALIGGDLGPRLLPIGSLAGLLWYAALERLNVHVPILQFIKTGAIVTVPSLATALIVLAFVT
ncbi:ArsB/NhaD family transporter [Leisingera sp. D0M16]|uniref:ArsB/NhaD family transporter n=1 Tax=Leisingera coralii TaxID=3351347 RepID=UPI003B7D1E62